MIDVYAKSLVLSSQVLLCIVIPDFKIAMICMNTAHDV